MPRIKAPTLAEHRERTWLALERAVEVLLVDQDVDRISLGDIAERAGIARSTLYNYAPDKTALLTAMVARRARDLAESVAAIASDTSQPPSLRLISVVETMLGTFATSNHRVFLLYARTHSSSGSTSLTPLVQLATRIQSILDDGSATGEFSADLDPAVDIVLMTGLMESAVRAIVLRPETAPLITRRAISLLTAAIGARQA